MNYITIMLSYAKFNAGEKPIGSRIEQASDNENQR